MVYNRMDQGWGTVALIPLEDILKETRDGVRNILGIEIGSAPVLVPETRVYQVCGLLLEK